MAIKLRTIFADPQGTAQPGQIISRSAEQEAALIQGGYAERVPDTTPVQGATPTEAEIESARSRGVETAAVESAPETAVTGKPSKRKR